MKNFENPQSENEPTNEPTIEELGQQLKAEGEKRLKKNMGVEEPPTQEELKKRLEKGKEELKKQLLKEGEQDPLKQAG